MKFTKYFIILSICLLMWTCDTGGDIDIDIGDYEAQLAAWNNQNMLDYQIYVKRRLGIVESVIITVRSGVPEKNGKNSWWIEAGLPSTIPEVYSRIKKNEKGIRNDYKNKNSSYSFNVTYNTEFHYPNYIIKKENGWESYSYSIILTPPGETEQKTGVEE